MSKKKGFFHRLGIGVFWDIVLFFLVMTVAILFGLSSLEAAYGLTIGTLIIIGVGFYVYRRRASAKRQAPL
jgi:K+ transporter